ncbi:DUF2780 domain-containing protein [Corallincola platygyrae]|uniref:DUF2780 domain-containing protein n=1 Tax=Corallincola platygyrae TaxID=1193278 RepID=A0ABW4XRL6_9GAMM
MLKQMFNRALLCTALLFVFTPLQAAANPLIDMVTQQLGVSPTQASGGLGALLSTAQKGMSGGDFAALGDVVPDMSSLLAAAPTQVSGDADTLGSMASGLLGDSEAASNAVALNQAFSSLGLDSGMVGQYSKILLDFVESEGGQALMESLKSALI